MRTYTPTSAARMLGIAIPELVHLVHTGVADAVDEVGLPVKPPGFDPSRHGIPEWVIAELADSPEYLDEALRL